MRAITDTSSLISPRLPARQTPAAQRRLTGNRDNLSITTPINTL